MIMKIKNRSHRHDVNSSRARYIVNMRNVLKWYDVYTY